MYWVDHDKFGYFKYNDFCTLTTKPEDTFTLEVFFFLNNSMKFNTKEKTEKKLKYIYRLTL